MGLVRIRLIAYFRAQGFSRVERHLRIRISLPAILCTEPKKLYTQQSRSMKTVLIAISLFIFVPLVSHPQPREAVFKRYTAEDGLPSSHIGCLWQDHRGFLWVGTGNGLYRFDGYNFKAFKRDPAD